MNLLRITLVTVVSIWLLVPYEVLAQASAAASAPTAEVIALRANLDAFKQFHDSFVAMSQWAFGTAIAFALSLALFSWFTNKSNYERDRDLLRQQVQTLREEIEVLVAKATTAAAKELEESMGKRQTAIQTAVEKSLQARLDTVARASKEATDLALGLKADSLIAIARAAQKEKRFAWAVYKYSEVLEIYVKRGTDFYEAAEILDEINTILKTPGASMDADAVSSAVAVFERLPKQHGPVAESLISRLKSALASSAA